MPAHRLAGGTKMFTDIARKNLLLLGKKLGTIDTGTEIDLPLVAMPVLNSLL